MAWMEEEVGKSSKWTVRHAHQEENRGELLLTEHLLCIHAAPSPSTYTLNLILTTLQGRYFLHFIDEKTEA